MADNSELTLPRRRKGPTREVAVEAAVEAKEVTETEIETETETERGVGLAEGVGLALPEEEGLLLGLGGLGSSHPRLQWASRCLPLPHPKHKSLPLYNL
jgi:hypothetical protein